MKHFWRYHVRYRLARALIHLALRIWPAGKGRDEVVELLWGWRSKVLEEIAKAQDPVKVGV